MTQPQFFCFAIATHPYTFLLFLQTVIQQQAKKMKNNAYSGTPVAGFITHSLRVLGRGVGQVMLQNNALSGFIMLAGIFLNSWQQGLMALYGTIISTLTAYLLGYDRKMIADGLYGFNGTLVGIASGVFLSSSPATWILLTVGCCLSTWITHLFTRQHLLPGLTAPFILITWLLLTGCTWIFPELLQSAGSSLQTTPDIHLTQALSIGIGQVMFQENQLTGLLFWIAILISSHTKACYALLGAFLPIVTVLLPGVDAETANLGLLGYNGVLCAIALGDKSPTGIAWASGSVLLSVFFQLAGMFAGITTLTAPFVLSVWIIWILKKAVDMKA